MRLVIQRVKKADVRVGQETIGKIEKGLLVFVGICNTDTKEIADKMIKKLIGLRIFEDENGKTNLDLKSVPPSSGPVIQKWPINYMNISLPNANSRFPIHNTENLAPT